MFGFTLFFPSENNTISLPKGFEEKLHGKVWCKWDSNKSFSNIKYLTETEDGVVGLDGVIFNEAKLLRQYGVSQREIIVQHWSNNVIPDEVIKGEFSCFWINSRGELFLKVNPNGTKPWFVVQSDNGLIVSNSLKSVSTFLKNGGDKLQVDEKACLELLTYGYLIGSKTTLIGVKKIRAGERLRYVNGDLEIIPSQTLNDISYNHQTKDHNAAKLHELLTENIKDSYDFNQMYGYENIATLSGGLDARANVLLAKQQGLKVHHTMAMGQSKHQDLTIAAKIADAIQSKHLAYILDSAAHLKLIKENVQLNEGLVLYSGSAHLYAMLSSFKSPIGLIQSGQMGNVIGGGNLSEPFMVAPNLEGKAYAKKHVGLTDEWVKEELKSWKNEEVSKINERVFNGVNNGSWISEAFGYYTSPFLQANVIGFSLSVHPKQKFEYELYMHWISTYLTDMNIWKWDRTGLAPVGTWTLGFGKWRNRVKKIMQIMLKQGYKASMNPYDYWFKKHAWLPEFVHQHWEENKHIIQPYHTSFEVASDIMEKGNLLNKTQVLTLVEGLKYHLHE